MSKAGSKRTIVYCEPDVLGIIQQMAVQSRHSASQVINAALRHLPPVANAIVILFLEAPSNPHEALGVEQHNTHARPVGRNQFCITH